MMQKEETKREARRDVACQTDSSSMFLGNISASAIKCKGPWSNYNNWPGVPDNSQLLMNSEQSPGSHFLGLSTCKSKAPRFDEEALEHMEGFGLTDEDQVKSKCITTTIRRGEEQSEDQSERQ